MIFSSSLISIILNKISINQTKLKNFLKNLNFYTLNHQIKLNRIKETIDLMTADLTLTRDAIKMLFKTNMTKRIRKKTKKNIAKAYRISFDRVLIENEVIRLREDEIRKNEKIMQKKMIAKTKKSIAAEKKRIHIEEMTMKKKKAKENQINQRIKKDIEIEEILSSSISKFFRFSVFDFANEENCVRNREIVSSDREK
jgi:hypothetical protein